MAATSARHDQQGLRLPPPVAEKRATTQANAPKALRETNATMPRLVARHGAERIQTDGEARRAAMLPANATDPPGLSTAYWARDPNAGQWRRTLQHGVVADTDSVVYRSDIATPARAAELDARAQAGIAGNIANSPGAIAARYELAYQRSGWAVNYRRCMPTEKRWRSDKKQRHLPTKPTRRAGASMR